MNEELLQRLEREAEKITLDMPASLHDREFTQVFNLEFARLIVEECVNVCDKIYFDRYADAEDWERSEEGDAIKKHFGVEE